MILSLSLFNTVQAVPANNSSKTVASEKVFTPETLLDEVESLIGEEVTIRGFVTHVCKHSGMKCFITGESGKTSMQIMAKGDIKSFDKELAGSEIKVKGIVKEHRMAKDVIDGRAQTANDMKDKGEVSMEQCDAVLSNVKEMREWMEKNKKDYFAIFYIDGQTYEVVD